MSAGKRSITINAFEKQIKLVLKSYKKPKKLAETSSLATYYFLGHVLGTERGTTSQELGEILCTEIRSAAETLWDGPLPQSAIEMRAILDEVRLDPGSLRYSYLVLDMRVFQRHFKPRRLADIWENEAYLPGSRAEHYRDFDIAVKHLGEALLDRVRPTFRLEQPASVDTLIGYELYLEQASEALQVGQVVSLNGPSGIGKTAIGSMLANRDVFHPVFWFTMRPSLNDQLPSLLFSLAFFLHCHGSSNLWQMILVNKGKLDDLNLAFGLVQEDLEQLQSLNLLLCFDELDRLDSNPTEETSPLHRQLLEFIDGLRNKATMLLIGQRPTIEADTYIELPGLATPHVQQLLKQASVELSKEDSIRIYEMTSGNPRLLILCIALLRMGDSLENLLFSLPKTQVLLPLLDRLWQRMNSNERRILQQLSVFRSIAPERAWQEEQPHLDSLIQRRLVQQDGMGGVMLLPALHETIYQELSTELREHLHLKAAEIRNASGEYTSAAYHYWQGGKDSWAIQLWHPHQEREIQRGQASTALVIFQNISRNRVGATERKVLSFIRATLHNLQGNAQQGLSDLEEEDWYQDSELSIRAMSLRGDFLRVLGHPDKALLSYNEGQEMTIRLLTMYADLHYRKGHFYLRNKEHALAKQETQKIQYEAERLNGRIHEEEGHFSTAFAIYQNALSIAEDLQDRFRIAQIHRRLSSLYGRQHNFEQSVAHANNALMHFEQIGDRLHMEMIRSDLSATYQHAKDFEKAIETAHKSLRFYKTVQYPLQASIAASNLAECYFEIGDLEKAQQYAQEALDQEEPYIYPYALYTLGQVKQAENDLENAEQILQQTIKYTQNNDDPYVEAYAQRALGRVYKESGLIDSAQMTMTKALQLFQQLGIEGEITETERELQTLNR